MTYKPRKTGSGWESKRKDLVEELKEYGYPEDFLRPLSTYRLGALWKRVQKTKGKMKTDPEVSKLAIKLGIMGGLKTKKKYGAGHFKRIGKIGANKRWNK